MDIQTGMIYVGIVGVCAVAVLGISFFGIKEKTYEEAIAEQRQMPNEHLLLGRNSKDKNKEKKSKKAAGKKVKEKLVEHMVSVDNTSESKPGVVQGELKSHVEFEFPEAEVVSGHPPQEDKKRKKKMKSILINKAEHNIVVAGTPVLANHFEESLPKDDLMLKRQLSKEDVSTKQSAPVKGNSKTSAVKMEKAPKVDKPNQSKAEKAPAKNEKAPVKNEKVAIKNEKVPAVTEKVTVKTEKAPAKVEKAPAKVEKVPIKSEKVPVKNEKVTVKTEKGPAKTEKVPAKTEKVLSKPSTGKNEKETVTVAASAETVDAPPAKEQRSRKKKSELATLQQMTGDREGVNVSLIVPLVQKAELSRSEIQNLIDLLLNKQQGPTVGNAEWSEGRQDPIVKLKKQLAEKEKALADEQEASQAFQNKLKELRVELNSDRSRWRQLEEVAASKQTEVQHVTTRLQLAQDAHKVDKTNLTQQLQHLQAKVNEDHLIIRKLQEEQSQTQGVMQQEILGQRQQLELRLSCVSDQHQEAEALYKNQLNQLHGQLQEQENINASLRSEVQNSRENAITRDTEIAMLRDKLTVLNIDIHRKDTNTAELRRQLDDLVHLNAKLEQDVKSNASAYQFEKEQLCNELDAAKGTVSKKVTDIQLEAERLQKEKDSLQAKVKDLQAIGVQAKDENTKLSSQLLVLLNDAKQMREENESLAAQVSAGTERPAAEGQENGDVSFAEEVVVKTTVNTAEENCQLESTLKEKETMIEELNFEIINYKTEISKLKDDLESQRQKNNELRTRNWKAMDALSAAEKSLETHLKESNKNNNLVSENKIITSKIEEQEKAIAQLQGVVATYKTIISDTETNLNSLQTSAEEEESKWSQKVQQRDVQLKELRDENQRLEQSLQEVNGANQEQSRLQSDLNAARDKERDMMKELVKLRSLVQIGQDSLNQEHKLSQDLQHQVDKLNGVNDNHNGGDTETTISEGGSGKK